jgi:hypothetical protein
MIFETLNASESVIEVIGLFFQTKGFEPPTVSRLDDTTIEIPNLFLVKLKCQNPELYQEFMRMVNHI